MSEHLIVSVEDGVGTIAFNRPDRMNAVSREMSEAMIDATNRFERDSDVRCVLFRGEGANFCAGGDVKGFHEALTGDREGHAAGMERRIMNGHLTLHRLRRMPKPVVVAAHGATAGVGISLLCAADLAIAADDAHFSLAYRHVGLSLDGGVSYFLPRIIGERRALQLALTGERFDAAQALDWGLLNWTTSAAKLRDEAGDLARKLARGPTRALGEIKQLLRRSLQSTWDEQSAAEARAIGETVASDDHFEGVTAFVEKRKASFTGR